jgi:hypothetical protein
MALSFIKFWCRTSFLILNHWHKVSQQRIRNALCMHMQLSWRQRTSWTPLYSLSQHVFLLKRFSALLSSWHYSMHLNVDRMLPPLCWDLVLTRKSTWSYMGLAVSLRLPRSESMAKGGILYLYVVWLEDRRFVSPCSAQGHSLFWELHATLCKYLYHLQALNLTRYYRWGYPFLYEAYLYYTDWRDHLHNFSPYFYLTYSGSGGTLADLLIWRQLLRSPFTSLIPQLTLSLGTGLVLGQFSVGLPFAWFVQTSVHVPILYLVYSLHTPTYT